MLKLLILIPLLFISIKSYAVDPPPPKPVARVIWIKGTLTAIMPTKEERKLQKMSIIYLKDTLVTDDKSQAQIAFTDDTLITFEKNTKFAVDQYQFNKKKSVGKSLMNLVQGGFRTITGIVAKKTPENYSVHTPVATIGVRGTEYRVYLDTANVDTTQLDKADYSKANLYMEHHHGQPCINNSKGALCLNEKNKYGKINLNQAPVVLPTKPDFFKDDLPIVAAKISDFGSSQGGGSDGGKRGGGGGNSFCILP